MLESVLTLENLQEKEGHRIRLVIGDIHSNSYSIDTSTVLQYFECGWFSFSGISRCLSEYDYEITWVTYDIQSASTNIDIPSVCKRCKCLQNLVGLLDFNLCFCHTCRKQFAQISTEEFFDMMKTLSII